MMCYSCRKYDGCELPWKCSSTMYDCSAYELEQTNEEYLKSCTTEQLAEFLADELNDVVEIVLEGVWLNDGDTDRDEYYQRKSDVLEWLKQPHSEAGK